MINMIDYIVDNVRKIRKKIEAENNGNWDQLEHYFKDKQEHHKTKVYKGKPKELPDRKAVHNLQELHKTRIELKNIDRQII